jgi:phosphatidylserine decarboxylase
LLSFSRSVRQCERHWRAQSGTPSKALGFFHIISQAPEDRLNRDERFNDWKKKYAQALGQFMHTPASAAGIPSYAARPNYHIDDYVVEPSGWLTFNQFFAREIKPGKRPIAAPCDDKVIVSAADSVFAGAWDIDADSEVTVKGVTWLIAKLLDGSPPLAFPSDCYGARSHGDRLNLS